MRLNNSLKSMGKKNTRFSIPEMERDLIRKEFIRQIFNADPAAESEFYSFVREWFYDGKWRGVKGIPENIDSYEGNINGRSCIVDFSCDKEWIRESFVIKELFYEFFRFKGFHKKWAFGDEYKQAFLETKLLNPLNDWLRRWNLVSAAKHQWVCWISIWYSHGFTRTGRLRWRR